ncbi:hypothetical protein [Cellulomonas sp. NPDC089187]|uniref:hypothetical protein n=1 Tax=Cellulomonas sp. NPDC089187 TaxID=3154970 RepID=UPI00343552EF
MSRRRIRPTSAGAVLIGIGLLLGTGGTAALAAPRAADLPTGDTATAAHRAATAGLPDPTDPDASGDVQPGAVDLTAPNTTACVQPADGYAPRGVCQLILERARAACVGGAPVLEYAVRPEGTPNTTVTLTWQNPGGADVVYSGLPLSGRVLWPGVVIEAGQVVDWPGWTRQADGSLTPGDQDDWVRPRVALLFQVNPSVATVVAYPSEAAPCANPDQTTTPEGQDDPVLPTSAIVDQPIYRSGVLAAEPTVPAGAFRSGVLATTGTDPHPELRLAGLLLAGGVVVLAVARLARRRPADD